MYAYVRSPPSSSPLISVPLDYVVQGHRGNIIQGLGCTNTLYNTTLAFPLFYMWPCLLSLIAIIYGILSLRALIKRQALAEEFLDCTDSDLKADRHFYFRFMCFSGVELVIAFPLGLYLLLHQAINEHVFPWISWEDTHSNFDRIDQYPAIFITSIFNGKVVQGVMLWSVPCLSYLFFLFFGFGPQQVKQYKRWFYVLLKPFGIKPHSTTDGRTWWQKLLRRPAPPLPLPFMINRPPSPPFATTSTSSLSSIMIIGNPGFNSNLDIDHDHDHKRLPREPPPAYATLHHNHNHNHIVDLNKARPILSEIR